LAVAATALGVLPLMACGSDRSVITAPSSAQVTAAPGGVFTVSREQMLPRGTVSTGTTMTVTAVVSGTSCPTLRFMISSYVFRVDAATQYQGGTCANIQAGAQINVSVTVESGTPTVLYVGALSFATPTAPPTPPPSPTPTPAPVQTEGTVTATGAWMCPELQFFIGSYAFNASSRTLYSGGACADIKPGVRVAIVGTKTEGEGFVRITNLTFKRDTSPTPEPPTTPLYADVTVSSLVSGTGCPSLSFMVGPYKITLSSATTFERGACVNIAAGAKLGLTGTRLGDGTIAASKIELKDTPNPTGPTGQAVEGEGVITALARTTVCPTKQFYIGTYVIMLDASTQYVGGACTDLAAGMKVRVKGTMRGPSTVAASVITIQNAGPQPTPEAEGEGVVTALVDGASCPALQFTISEYTITLTASTQFVGGSCTDIAAGKKLRVRGAMTGEKAATASLITFKE
jgi:hypothetical protein